MGVVEDFLNNPFIPSTTKAKPEGFKRYGSLAIRGATLGLAGAQDPAEGIAENVTEIGGSLPTIAGISALTSPVAGAALRAARIPAGPVLSRIAAASATGAPVGAARALTEGDNPLVGALKGAAEFGVLESGFIGGGKVLAKLRGKSKPSVAETIVETPEQIRARATIEASSKEVTDLPQLTLPLGQKIVDQQPELFNLAYYGPRISADGRNARTFKTYAQVEEEATTSAAERSGVRTAEERAVLSAEQAAEERAGTRLAKQPTQEEIALQGRAARGENVERVGLDAFIDQGGTEARPSLLGTATVKSVIRFKSEADPVTGRTIIAPLTPEAESAVQQVLNLPVPRATGLQITPTQADFLTTPGGQKVLQGMDTITKNEPLTTSALLKKTEAEVEKIVTEGEPAKVADFFNFTASTRSKEFEEIANKLGMTPTDMKEVKSGARKIYQDFTGTQEEKIAARNKFVQEYLQKKCK